MIPFFPLALVFRYFQFSHPLTAHTAFRCVAAPKKTCDRKTEFDCGDGMCIPLSKVCDKSQDCPDGEDEPVGKCGRDECKSNNGGCSQLCVDTQAGFYCECRQGYKLSSDNRTCEDINECEIPGSCSQLCTNERGGFKVSADDKHIEINELDITISVCSFSHSLSFA
jgi:hypothetical protein